VRIAVVGRSIPTSRQLISEVLVHWRPEQVIILENTGLAKAASAMALELEIPVVSFWRDYFALRGLAIEVAAEQAVVVGKPDLLLAVAMGRRDHRVIKVFRDLHVRVVIGSCRQGGVIDWAKV